MCDRVPALVLAAILLLTAFSAGVAGADSPQGGAPGLAVVPKAAISPNYGPPAAGPRPYYGEALGATYYNWGYFGAHQHLQKATHWGYDNTYWELGHSRGY
jgi:hypothetical protein